MVKKLEDKIAASMILMSEYLDTFLKTNIRKDRDKVLTIRGKIIAYKEMLQILNKEIN